jgi:hypothetical protein
MMRIPVRVTKLFLGPASSTSMTSGSEDNQRYSTDCHGTVQSGHDLLGAFGPPGASLAGSAFDGEFIFGPPTDGAITAGDDVQACAQWEAAVIGASVTINGCCRRWEAQHCTQTCRSNSLPVRTPYEFAYRHDVLHDYLEDFAGRLLFQMTNYEGPLSAKDPSARFADPIRYTRHAQRPRQSLGSCGPP